MSETAQVVEGVFAAPRFMRVTYACARCGTSFAREFPLDPDMGCAVEIPPRYTCSNHGAELARSIEWPIPGDSAESA